MSTLVLSCKKKKIHRLGERRMDHPEHSTWVIAIGNQKVAMLNELSRDSREGEEK